MIGSTPYVLVVDDDPSLRKLARVCLESMGLYVEEVDCGRSGITRLDARAPALVCLDLMLPEISGFDVCDHIRRTPHLAKVPILIMSTRSSPVDRAFAEEAGAAGYITKPFSIVAFQGAVRSVLQAAYPLALPLARSSSSTRALQ